MKITTQFINIDGINIYLRISGNGPIVFVFHQSPQSSLSSIEWINELGNEFCIIAPDSPGYGHSDPLAVESPSVSDFAGIFVKLIKQMNIENFAVIGTHTGAAIAAKVAVLMQEKVFAAFFDGFPAFAEEELTDLLSGYLPDFKPNWDGSHLAWLWSRIREQTIFFPWYNSQPENRMFYDCRDPEGMHEWAIDFLLAGNNYSSAYSAAFKEDGSKLSAEVHCPALFCCHESDPLLAHQDSLKMATDMQQRIVIRLESNNKFDIAEDFFKQHSSDYSIDNKQLLRQSKRAGKTIISTDVGEICAYFQDVKENSTPINKQCRLWLHDLTNSIESIKQHIPKHSQHLEIALDLPGHGLTNVHHDCYSPAEFANIVKMNLKVNPNTIFTEGGSLGYAIAFANEFDNCRVISVNGFLFNSKINTLISDESFPDLNPTWNGSHLQSAWQASRLSRLFWPWNKTLKSHIIPGKPDLDASSIAQQTVDWLYCADDLQKIVQQLHSESEVKQPELNIDIIFHKNHPAINFLPEKIAHIHFPITDSEYVWTTAINLN